jgi:hypothetical protein
MARMLPRSPGCFSRVTKVLVSRSTWMMAKGVSLLPFHMSLSGGLCGDYSQLVWFYKWGGLLPLVVHRVGVSLLTPQLPPWCGCDTMRACGNV